MVFNPLGWERKDIVKIESESELAVVDTKGKDIPGQRLGKEMLFIVAVPSLGYNTYGVEKRQGQAQRHRGTKVQSGASRLFENDYYSVGYSHKQGLVIDNKGLKWRINKAGSPLAGILVQEEKGTLLSMTNPCL